VGDASLSNNRLLEHLNERLTREPSRLTEAKKRGQKIIGYFCPYVPEELILAGGMLPLRLAFGGELEPASAGEEYLKPYSCPCTRSCVGYQLTEDNEYHQLVDAFCIAQTCENIKHVQEYIEYQFHKPVIKLGLSHVHDASRARPHALDYYRDELGLFRQRLSELAGRRISRRDINREIKRSNLTREILRTFFECSRADRPVLPWYDAFRILQAGFLMNRRDYYEEVKAIQHSLPSQRVSTGRRAGIRLLIIGSLIGIGDLKVLDIIQSVGGEIVADAVCTGSSSVRKDVMLSGIFGDPLDALAERYLYNVPCPCMIDMDRRKKRAAAIVKDYRVAGVIYYSLKYCDTWRSEFKTIKEYVLQETGVPSLLVESNYSPSDIGITRTKIEAFLEMVGGI
jgi:benzoyl-CoA reductase/2-hydroxyglutaryl-CoA dehydratase subunit BcrC/BadD/HgdB